VVRIFAKKSSDFVQGAEPDKTQQQTPKENKFPTGHAFEIILPNLIHKSKKRNLK